MIEAETMVKEVTGTTRITGKAEEEAIKDLMAKVGDTMTAAAEATAEEEESTAATEAGAEALREEAAPREDATEAPAPAEADDFEISSILPILHILD